MATVSETFYRDGNRVPITNAGIITKKSVTFAGATADAWGNDGGALDGGTLFTVTGLVMVQLVGVCNVDCAGSNSTNEVGVDGTTNIFMPTTTMTDLVAPSMWFNNGSPGEYFVPGEAAADNMPKYVLSGMDIIMTTKTANTTAGQIDFYCIWTPLSTDANLVAA